MERFIKSAAGRRWLYGVAIAAVALAAAYGLITEETGALWVAVVAALLGLPVAAGNVTNAGAKVPPVEDPEWPEGSYDPMSGARWATPDTNGRHEASTQDYTDDTTIHSGEGGDYPVGDPHGPTQADPERYAQ